MLTIKLEESDCFSAWMMGGNVQLEKSTADVKCEWRENIHVLEGIVKGWEVQQSCGWRECD